MRNETFPQGNCPILVNRRRLRRKVWRDSNNIVRASNFASAGIACLAYNSQATEPLNRFPWCILRANPQIYSEVAQPDNPSFYVKLKAGLTLEQLFDLETDFRLASEYGPNLLFAEMLQIGGIGLSR